MYSLVEEASSQTCDLSGQTVPQSYTDRGDGLPLSTSHGEGFVQTSDNDDGVTATDTHGHKEAILAGGEFSNTDGSIGSNASEHAAEQIARKRGASPTNNFNQPPTANVSKRPRSGGLLNGQVCFEGNTVTVDGVSYEMDYNPAESTHNLEELQESMRRYSDAVNHTQKK